MSSARFRSHLAAAALAAFAATAGTALVSRTADADRDSNPAFAADHNRARAQLSYYQAAHRELTAGLGRLETIGRQSNDRRTRFQVQRVVDDTRSRAGRYVGDGRTGDQPDRPDRGGHHGHRRPDFQPLADADFQRLVARVADGYPSEVQGVVTTAAASNYFTVDQAVALIKACRFDSARVEIGVALYPRVVDPQRWFLVDEAFDYSSSRAALKQRIEKGNLQPLTR